MRSILSLIVVYAETNICEHLNAAFASSNSCSSRSEGRESRWIAFSEKRVCLLLHPCDSRRECSLPIVLSVGRKIPSAATQEVDTFPGEICHRVSSRGSLWKRSSHGASISPESASRRCSMITCERNDWRAKTWLGGKNERREEKREKARVNGSNGYEDCARSTSARRFGARARIR